MLAVLLGKAEECGYSAKLEFTVFDLFSFLHIQQVGL